MYSGMDSAKLEKCVGLEKCGRRVCEGCAAARSEDRALSLTDDSREAAQKSIPDHSEANKTIMCKKTSASTNSYASPSPCSPLSVVRPCPSPHRPYNTARAPTIAPTTTTPITPTLSRLGTTDLRAPDEVDFLEPVVAVAVAVPLARERSEKECAGQESQWIARVRAG